MIETAEDRARIQGYLDALVRRCWPHQHHFYDIEGVKHVVTSDQAYYRYPAERVEWIEYIPAPVASA